MNCGPSGIAQLELGSGGTEVRGERAAELSLAKSQRLPMLVVDGRRVNRFCFEPTKLIFFCLLTLL